MFQTHMHKETSAVPVGNQEDDSDGRERVLHIVNLLASIAQWYSTAGDLHAEIHRCSSPINIYHRGELI